MQMGALLCGAPSRRNNKLPLSETWCEREIAKKKNRTIESVREQESDIYLSGFLFSFHLELLLLLLAFHGFVFLVVSFLLCKIIKRNLINFLLTGAIYRDQLTAAIVVVVVADGAAAAA